jgi:hypothetical protein
MVIVGSGGSWVQEVHGFRRFMGSAVHGSGFRVHELS